MNPSSFDRITGSDDRGSRTVFDSISDVRRSHTNRRRSDLVNVSSRKTTPVGGDQARAFWSKRSRSHARSMDGRERKHTTFKAASLVAKVGKGGASKASSSASSAAKRAVA